LRESLRFRPPEHPRFACNEPAQPARRGSGRRPGRRAGHDFASQPTDRLVGDCSCAGGDRDTSDLMDETRLMRSVRRSQRVRGGPPALRNYAFSGSNGKTYGLFMVDVDSGTVWCHELRAGRMTSCSFVWWRPELDVGPVLEEFNVAEPVPAAVRAMIQQQRHMAPRAGRPGSPRQGASASLARVGEGIVGVIAGTSSRGPSKVGSSRWRRCITACRRRCEASCPRRS
jgi:hypothetical protein